MVQKLSWSDLREQFSLVLQLEDPCLIDRVYDQRVCLKLRLGIDLLIVYVRLPCDFFYPKNVRLVIVRDSQVLNRCSRGAMESEVSLVGCLVFSR